MTHDFGPGRPLSRVIYGLWGCGAFLATGLRPLCPPSYWYICKQATATRIDVTHEGLTDTLSKDYRQSVGGNSRSLPACVSGPGDKRYLLQVGEYVQERPYLGQQA